MKEALERLNSIEKNNNAMIAIRGYGVTTSEDIETIRRALKGWESIESAPRDGTAILGWHEKLTIPIIVWWVEGAGKWSSYLQPTKWHVLASPPQDKGD